MIRRIVPLPGGLVMAAGLALLLGMAPSPAGSGPVEVGATPVPLNPGDPGQRRVGQLEYLAGFALSGDSPDWGGLSGMVLSPDGMTLTAIADVGFWYRLRLRLDATGRLIGIVDAEMGPLLDQNGKALDGKENGDAESLSRTADGSLYVTFEGRHRIWRYAALDNPLLGAAHAVRAPAGMKDLPRNLGIEAAAFLAGGRLLLLSEGGRTADGDLRGWIGDGKQWKALTLATTGEFVPTDLCVLPGGDVLLLERSFSMLDGAAARLSIIPAASIVAGARLAGREIAVIRRPLTVDNFEDVAARKGADGSTLIYIMSDDNQSLLERTLLLQFRLVR
jgi:hypothetical protein